MNRFVHLNQTIKSQGLLSYLSRCWYFIQARLLSRFFPMGHGAVLHYPDWPFLKWSYVNFRGEVVDRNNPKDFFEAACELYKFFCRYIAGNPNAKVPAMNVEDENKIQEMLATLNADDGDARCKIWIETIARGEFSFGPAQISYTPKGPGSWKFEALGTKKVRDVLFEKFEYSDKFLLSDWKLFHDAVQDHQHKIIHQILPQFDICVI